MFIRNDYPILEFDDNRDAKINPTIWVDKKFECNKMVITFFPEVVDKLIADGKIVLEKTIGGENVVLVYRFVDTDILITLGAVGCPSWIYLTPWEQKRLCFVAVAECLTRK